MDLFKENVPLYFAAHEIDDFLNNLDNELEEYYVYEVNGIIFGAGGINYKNDYRQGIISWDAMKLTG